MTKTSFYFRCESEILLIQIVFIEYYEVHSFPSSIPTTTKECNRVWAKQQKRLYSNNKIAVTGYQRFVENSSTIIFVLFSSVFDQKPHCLTVPFQFLFFLFFWGGTAGTGYFTIKQITSLVLGNYWRPGSENIHARQQACINICKVRVIEFRFVWIDYIVAKVILVFVFVFLFASIDRKSVYAFHCSPSPFSTANFIPY